MIEVRVKLPITKFSVQFKCLTIVQRKKKITSPMSYLIESLKYLNVTSSLNFRTNENCWTEKSGRLGCFLENVCILNGKSPVTRGFYGLKKLVTIFN